MCCKVLHIAVRLQLCPRIQSNKCKLLYVEEAYGGALELIMLLITMFNNVSNYLWMLE